MLRRTSNDFLLPTMITFLNSRDWQLRAAFFRCVPCLAAAGGNAGIEDFLLPCCLQVRCLAVPRASANAQAALPALSA